MSATTPQQVELAARLLAALPQTQCTRCGFPDCAAYANAIASENAAINQCPPGGYEGVIRLAVITQQVPVPLNPQNGVESPRGIAVIDEAWCIGCTLCIKVCPTDAIIGSNKLMHTVIEPYCTGCELCLPVCPVDCIEMIAISGERTGWQAWSAEDAAQAKSRYEFHQLKAVTQSDDSAVRLEGKANSKLADLTQHTHGHAPGELERKRRVIEAALNKAREQRESKLKSKPPA